MMMHGPKQKLGAIILGKLAKPGFDSSKNPEVGESQAESQAESEGDVRPLEIAAKKFIDCSKAEDAKGCADAFKEMFALAEMEDDSEEPEMEG